VSEVVLIDAGGANLGSVRYALERLGATVKLVRDAEGLAGAQRVILPGVGAPLMGICLGMQLLFDRSEEAGVDTLGLIPGVVRKLVPACGIRVPHMGWNRLLPLRPSLLLQGVPERASAYFVHSYAAPLNSHTVAACDHGGLFTAVVEQGRYFGAQFHPERSGDTGSLMLRNFLEGTAA
jgi:glutamine amidotransferase